jgi:hypothetical protein
VNEENEKERATQNIQRTMKNENTKKNTKKMTSTVPLCANPIAVPNGLHACASIYFVPKKHTADKKKKEEIGTEKSRQGKNVNTKMTAKK